MSASRLSQGGHIDRSRIVSFRFDGVRYSGFEGDTLASALIANGVWLMGRSFKYHRKRGPIAAGVEEPNALVTVKRGKGRVDSNVRATVVELYEGLEAQSQNRWPSLSSDVGGINNWLAPFLPAGFYYKTFMWPRNFWKDVYEPNIRNAAGLGKAPSDPDPDRYQNRHAHCDLLIVGAGPAGIAAALAASEAGLKILLADEQARMGGGLLHEGTALIDQRPAHDWLDGALETLKGRPNVTLLPRTTAIGYLNHNHIIATERLTDHLALLDDKTPRERLWQIRARQVILATGAHERPLVFGANDRPGILLAEAGRVYLNRYSTLPGKTIVVFTVSNSAYTVALEMRRAGASVTIIDGRDAPDKGLAAECVAAGIALIPNAHVTDTKGGNSITHAIITNAAGSEQTIACDCLLMSGGWTPAVHLFSQSRGALAYEKAIDAFVPGASRQAETSVGACKGSYALGDCLVEGYAAGVAAAKKLAGTSVRPPETLVDDAPATGFTPLPVIPDHKRPSRWKRAFLDFQNDVTSKDIKLAIREGFRSVEHFKRYTTNGMATDQGKTSNMNAIGIASEALNVPPQAIGTTTFRMPYTPATFGAIVGPARGVLFDPTRKTPIYAWALKHGALFEDVGLWKRAWYFPRSGEDQHAAVKRECAAVRKSVGMFDASTLGKIEVVGPDAGEFLNRMYVNNFSKLAVGKCRYGLFLRDDGYIIDDGIIARIAEDRYHVTTTTGGAARVLHQMEDYLQTEFTDLKAKLTTISEQWSVIAVQGPFARNVIAPLIEGVDLSETGLPPMGFAEGTICGVPMRLFRASFTGEVGYEVNVPADFGEAVWEAIFEAGKPFDITPYGTEAMHVLRAERGFIIVGQDTDGTMTPDDVGLGGMVAQAKPDFVGKRGLLRPDLVAAGRKQLVGLLADDPKFVLDEGAQIVDTPNQPIPMKMIGHVTSSYDSPAVGRSIAMAVIQNGRARMGETVHVTTPKGFTKAVIAKPVFYDETGEKVKSTGDFTAPARIEKIAERRTCLARKPVIGVAGGPIHVVQVAPMARFVLKGTIGYGTGLSFQQEINHAEADGALHSLRLGPAEWLAIAPDSERETLVAAIKGRASSVVDISHRNVALSITGAKVCEVLNSGVPLDLDLAAFPIGMATRTLLGKAEILLWRKGEQAFHIECWRSFSFYVHAYLAEAAREFL